MASALPLQGKVAIVTGGSRGIGEAICLELARRGARVAFTYVSAHSVKRTKELIDTIASFGNGARALAIKGDLRHVDAPKKIVEEALNLRFSPDGEAERGGIDILVNNAGCDLTRYLSDITLDDMAAVYDLNVRGPLLMTQAVLPHLPKTGGRIINIGSVGARRGFPGLSLYTSSKAALEAFSRCWAAELGTDGHTVNTINVGPTETEMIQRIDPEIVAGQKANTPMQNRLADVSDIALIVAFLASEDSRWITGQAIAAAGGSEMY